MKLRSTLLLLLLSTVLSFGLVLSPGLEEWRVTHVVDGDTFYAERETVGRTKFRLIGINAPESKHPYKPVEPFSKEASDYLKKRIDGKKVLLEYDVQRKDRYQRTLVYVYSSDTSFINAELVRAGLAQVSTFPPNVKYADVFREDQRKARSEGIGMWSE